MERKILECSVILETDRFKNLEIQQKARNEYFRRIMKILKSKQNNCNDKLALREKYPNMDFFSGPYFLVFSSNTAKYVPEKPRTWTLFAQCRAPDLLRRQKKLRAIDRKTTKTMAMQRALFP